ncbi:MAG: uroporphyrinogen-III synthase [Methanomicrobiales archaeon]|nr:uroporphyrinogen-III synthase [Methanomicrobiales archaeon]
MEKDVRMRIAVTRLEGKSGGDARLCRRYGHVCYAVSPLKAEIDRGEVERFLDEVNKKRLDCIFFSSALPAMHLAPEIRFWPRTIAIGPQTALVLRSFAPHVEVLPGFYSREFAPYCGEWLKGRRIGLPRADVPNERLVDGIREAGGIPLEFKIYRLEPTGRELDIERADALLFTSAKSFSAARWQRRPDLLLIAIGEITAEVMREGGAVPSVIGDGSLEGTLKELNRYLQGRTGNTA